MEIAKHLLWLQKFGYGVKDVKVDGNSVGPVTSYTFENVNENHTIEVEFDRATFVFTAQDFRDAVTKDGIIILANDITIDDNGNVEISKNVIIHGGGHTIIGQRYEGVGYSRPAFVSLIGNAKTKIENCNFNYSGNHAGGLNLSDNSEAEIFGGDYSQIFTGGSSNLIIHYGNFTELEMNAYSKVNIYGGVYGQKNKKSWEYSLGEPFSSITISLHGGTCYFDPGYFLDTATYIATQTKDAAGVDIWVVTEK